MSLFLTQATGRWTSLERRNIHLQEEKHIIKILIFHKLLSRLGDVNKILLKQL